MCYRIGHTGSGSSFTHLLVSEFCILPFNHEPEYEGKEEKKRKEDVGQLKSERKRKKFEKMNSERISEN